ncbi:MAG: acetolactate decarboxylase [Campylobacterota bacterium]|nr:acetolactate decarboxylase [Campylobacterota bacterium]
MKIIYLVIILLFTSCNDSNLHVNLNEDKTEAGTQLYQISTIQALLAGLYDGDLTVGDLQEHGDFGIGTFNGIDGEMIVYDGTVYQVKSDGHVYVADKTTGVPFACVHFFQSDINTTLNNITSYEALKTSLNGYKECKNYPCAFKIDGTFNYIKTRSEPKASKPYPPLAEYITDNQVYFEAQNISGTLIGYVLPQYFEKVNVVGYHLHFLSDDKTFGGHVLELSLNSANIQLDKLYEFKLSLLKTTEFENSSLEHDKDAVDKVEK